VKRALAVVACLAAPALADGKKRTPKQPPTTTQPQRPVPPRQELPSQQPPAPPPPSEVEHKEGEYGGVVPGQPQPPTAKPKRLPAKGTLSWIGFEVKDGGAEIFLQSAAPFEVAQHVEGATLVANLTGVVRLGHNVWRPIDTRFFDTSIARVAARPVGAARATKTAPAHGVGVEVRVAFKNVKDAREAAVRTAGEQDGFFYAYLTFQKADAATTGTSTKDPEQ
jgi:hypothetical protein